MPNNTILQDAKFFISHEIGINDPEIDAALDDVLALFAPYIELMDDPISAQFTNSVITNIKNGCSLRGFKLPKNIEKISANFTDQNSLKPFVANRVSWLSFLGKRVSILTGKEDKEEKKSLLYKHLLCCACCAFYNEAASYINNTKAQALADVALNSMIAGQVDLNVQSLHDTELQIREAALRTSYEVLLEDCLRKAHEEGARGVRVTRISTIFGERYPTKFSAYIGPEPKAKFPKPVAPAPVSPKKVERKTAEAEEIERLTAMADNVAEKASIDPKIVKSADLEVLQNVPDIIASVDLQEVPEDRLISELTNIASKISKYQLKQQLFEENLYELTNDPAAKRPKQPTDVETDVQGAPKIKQDMRDKLLEPGDRSPYIGVGVFGDTTRCRYQNSDVQALVLTELMQGSLLMPHITSSMVSSYALVGYMMGGKEMRFGSGSVASQVIDLGKEAIRTKQEFKVILAEKKKGTWEEKARVSVTPEKGKPYVAFNEKLKGPHSFIALQSQKKEALKLAQDIDIAEDINVKEVLDKYIKAETAKIEYVEENYGKSPEMDGELKQIRSILQSMLQDPEITKKEKSDVAKTFLERYQETRTVEPAKNTAPKSSLPTI